MNNEQTHRYINLMNRVQTFDLADHTLGSAFIRSGLPILISEINLTYNAVEPVLTVIKGRHEKDGGLMLKDFATEVIDTYITTHNEDPAKAEPLKAFITVSVALTHMMNSAIQDALFAQNSKRYLESLSGEALNNVLTKLEASPERSEVDSTEELIEMMHISRLMLDPDRTGSAMAIAARKLPPSVISTMWFSLSAQPMHEELRDIIGRLLSSDNESERTVGLMAASMTGVASESLMEFEKFYQVKNLYKNEKFIEVSLEARDKLIKNLLEDKPPGKDDTTGLDT